MFSLLVQAAISYAVGVLFRYFFIVSVDRLFLLTRSWSKICQRSGMVYPEILNEGIPFLL